MIHSIISITLIHKVTTTRGDLMISEYIKALLLIFVAEMGDKTQILAMIFSTRYKIQKVLIGVAIGSFLNHGIAIVLGRYIGTLVPTYILQMIAGLAFLGFALWTVLEKDDDEEDELGSSSGKGAIITVASAFFLGELGDKTQLTAITLSVDAAYPVLILLGTVSGMVLTSSLGIFVGSKIGHKVPDRVLKIFSALVFTLFGSIKLMTTVPSKFVTWYTSLGLVLVIVLILVLTVKAFISWRQLSRRTAYQKAAKQVYDYFNQVEEDIELLCRGVNHCGSCAGTGCAIGYLKTLVKQYKTSGVIEDETLLREEIVFVKDKFEVNRLVGILAVTIIDLQTHDSKDVHQVKEVIEMILLDRIIPWKADSHLYLEEIKLINEEIASKLTGIIVRET